MDLLHPPEKKTSDGVVRVDEHDAYLDLAGNALDAGVAAVRALAEGGSADVAALDAYATLLEAMRRGYLHDGRTITAEHVEVVRQLADLARAGAPQEAVTAAARQVEATLPAYRVPERYWYVCLTAEPEPADWITVLDKAARDAGVVYTNRGGKEHLIPDLEGARKVLGLVQVRYPSAAVGLVEF
jgi:hypothetical protein